MAVKMVPRTSKVKSGLSVARDISSHVEKMTLYVFLSGKTMFFQSNFFVLGKTSESSKIFEGSRKPEE